MNRSFIKVLLALAALGASTLFLTSCRTPSDTDNTVPWNRPATWEGGIPGMGTMPGQGQQR